MILDRSFPREVKYVQEKIFRSSSRAARWNITVRTARTVAIPS